MTSKQRLLSALKGEKVDYIPFSPNLAYYFDFLPEETRNKGIFDYIVNMGADPLMRGDVQAFEIKQNKCSTKVMQNGNKIYTTITTPKGNLNLEQTCVELTKTCFISKHPVSTIEGIELLKLYFEDLDVLPQIVSANEKIKDLGEKGLQLAILGIGLKSAFQSLLEHWIGIENLVYLCMDYPDEIDELLKIMQAKNLKTVEYTANSNISACISWEDSSTTNLSPAMYEKYIAPEISNWCKILKQVDKFYVQHACGHIKDLLVPMAKQGISGIESICPPPTGNITIKQAVQDLPKNISIIGGIEPTHFLNDPINIILE